ncbi:pheromone-processing carboxypeptidase KEX1-like [Lycium barbarum]|uniref:pheromone-processing carboxypeptidase KEX1-like n=1 Tax=Lycium barbarum TaxID=112863 RepID=UPI00293F5917|nr:pheromone-processing carboxypeptidase KEX1-like [Lycium barbarum]
MENMRCIYCGRQDFTSANEFYRHLTQNVCQEKKRVFREADREVEATATVYIHNRTASNRAIAGEALLAQVALQREDALLTLSAENMSWEAWLTAQGVNKDPPYSWEVDTDKDAEDTNEDSDDTTNRDADDKDDADGEADDKDDAEDTNAEDTNDGDADGEADDKDDAEDTNDGDADGEADDKDDAEDTNDGDADD